MRQPAPGCLILGALSDQCVLERCAGDLYIITQAHFAGNAAERGVLKSKPGQGASRFRCGIGATSKQAIPVQPRPPFKFTEASVIKLGSVPLQEKRCLIGGPHRLKLNQRQTRAQQTSSTSSYQNKPVLRPRRRHCFAAFTIRRVTPPTHGVAAPFWATGTAKIGCKVRTSRYSSPPGTSNFRRNQYRQAR